MTRGLALHNYNYTNLFALIFFFTISFSNFDFIREKDKMNSTISAESAEPRLLHFLLPNIAEMCR